MTNRQLAALVEAVRGTDTQLHVTGNSRKLDPAVLANASANVHFTGFLAEEAYWDCCARPMPSSI